MDENDTTNANPSGFLNLGDASALALNSSVEGGLSALEQDTLDEYARLARNMKTLASLLATLASGPITIEIAEGLRLLERKVASVYTLMKASVYSIVLQQGQTDDYGEDEVQG